VIPLATLEAVREITADAGVGLHCDGARIWHAHVADGVPLATYGGLFDTMSVCLSKGLGAPVGSVMLASAERIAEARGIRKRLGGGMRQVGILAAAGRYALAHHIDRLAEDHAKARRLAEGLAPFGLVDPARVRTNIVSLDLSKSSLDAAGLATAARAEGLIISVMGARLARLVTHYDVDEAAIDRAVEILTGVLRG
jgi:threonine aldolase